jgi:CRISPR-associated endonuclease/helicase Cas3
MTTETDIAKPGKSLLVSEHLRHVHDAATELMQRHPVAAQKYRVLTVEAYDALCSYCGQTDGRVAAHPEGLDLAALVKFSALVHDEGKRGKWSDAARQGASHLYKLNYRHEIQSALLCVLGKFHPTTEALLEEAGVAGLHTDRRYRIWILLAVLAHHGYLGVDEPGRYEWVWNPPSGNGHFRKVYDQVLGLSNAASQAKHPDAPFALKVACSVPRAYLQLADHKASAAEEGKSILEWTPFRYEPRTKLRDVQRVMKRRQDAAYLLLRAGTGTGKTDAALMWIAHQIALGRADRGVIALPTRFTTSALSLSAKNGQRISDVGLYHSSALFTVAKESNRPLDALFSANATDEDKATLETLRKRLEESRALYNPLTAVTLDQLLLCLTGAREIHHTTLASLLTSAIVLDEADFYDPFTQKALDVFLEFCRFAKIPVLIMSATLPDFAIEAYQRIIPEFEFVEATENLDNDQGGLILHPHPIETLADWQTVPVNPKKSLIVYQNTIGRAQVAYEHFKHLYPWRCVLYHSQFTQEDKAVKEDVIQRALGRKAKGPFCAVMTQIGEMSLNVSGLKMITDACPADRMAQRKGRHARFSTKGREDIIVVIPAKNGAVYPAPYGSPPVSGRPEWIPHPAFERFLNELVNHSPAKLTPRYWVGAINRCTEPGDSDRGITNQGCYRKEIASHWALLPADQKEQEDRTQNFKTREMGPQLTVHLEIDFQSDNKGNVIMGGSELQLYRQMNSLEMPSYRVEPLAKAGKINRITIKTADREEDLLVLSREFYNAEVGVIG